MARMLVQFLVSFLPLLMQTASIDSYVVQLGDSTSMQGRFDHAELSRMKRAHGGRYFWFTRDGKAYIVTDATVLTRAEAILKPQQELGQKQAALGEKQAALGQKQADLGAQQAELGAQQATARDEAEQARLSREQERLSQKQEALSRQQETLGREQEKLGQEQERLGRRAEEQLNELAEESIGNGKAKPAAN